MASVRETGRIDKNGELRMANIDGNIKKIVVKTKDIYPNVKVKVISGVKETIMDRYLQNELVFEYPVNVIHTDYNPSEPLLREFFNVGPLSIEVEGLSAGDVIENIWIFID